MIPSMILRSIELLFFIYQVVCLFEFYILMRRNWPTRVWTWSALSKDMYGLSSWTIKVLQEFTTSHGYQVFFYSRVILTFIVFIYPHWAIYLLLMVALLVQLMMWRGNFNGGSDFMSLVVLTGIIIARIQPQSENFIKAGIWYISLHSISSYFIAGWVKVKSAEWRNGHALIGFLRSRIYGEQGLEKLLREEEFLKVATWIFLLIECSFPLVLLFPKLAWAYCAFGIIFHLVNFFFFGLNRFFWIWMATYPAIIASSQFLAQKSYLGR